MNDWTAGYMTDINYTYGYYSELNPQRIGLAFLNRGLVFPEVTTACELGFGQGLSVAIHAAGSTAGWHGTDFNPAQAAFAGDLVAASGADARLRDDAFAEFCTRPDLPDFDFIGLHGIWSWISDANRAVIVDFVRRRLKVGGVLYISYNTLPGWAAFAPMRHLMAGHADLLGAEGRGIVNRVDGAIDFAEKLLATNPLFSRANPLVGERLKKMKEQNRHYLAHEYFNRDWHPMHFATMADWLDGAKLDYACSAHYLDHLDAVNLTPAQQTFLAEVPDPMFRETVRDFMVNQQFRRDYWVKGARRLSALERAEALRSRRVMLANVRDQVSMKISGALGEASLNDAVYGPVLDLLADLRPRSLGQIEQSLRGKGLSFAQIVEACLVLTGAGHLCAVQEDNVAAKVRRQTDRLNAHLCGKARSGGDIAFLASPVTGGGVVVDRIQQLFLAAISQGGKQPADWAAQVWQTLSVQGQKLVKEGKPLETAEENMAELTAQARTFADRRLPLLRALQIA